MPNLLILRFNDTPTDDLVPPRDELEQLGELKKTGAAFPSVVDAALGFGRAFVSADADGLAAADVVPGATLATRDATVQAIVRWDLAAAAAYGSPQTIYARGKGTGDAEYVSAALELRVVNAALHIGEVRWLWQDLAGATKTQTGGHFQLAEDGFVMLTATRRWVSSSRVVLRYYLGDALLAEVESSDGEVGGGTTGTTSIGTRFVGAAWDRFFDGTIDELRVIDEALSAEEIAATWQRITVEQPRGYRMLLDLHDPGFPMSRDPSSRVQRETRMWGHALGYASAQAENVRENLLPDRAYGRVLERWEQITKTAPRPGDSIEDRRRRVVAKIRQRRGVSIPGIGDALAELLDTDPDNLEVVAFDQTTLDAWDTLNTVRWRHDPMAQWTIADGKLRVQSATNRFGYFDWCTSLMAVGGDGRGAAVKSTLAHTSIADGGEAGVMFGDRGHNNAIIFGVRNNGGAKSVVIERVLGGVPQGAVVAGGASAADVTLVLDQDPDALDTFTARWSETGGAPWIGGSVVLAGVETFQWAGHYARCWSDAAVAIDASFDDTLVRAPFGTRPFHVYVYRDPAIPGAPDVLGANAVLNGLKQAHTRARVVTTLAAKYDDPSTTYDSEPMGGI